MGLVYLGVTALLNSRAFSWPVLILWVVFYPTITIAIARLRRGARSMIKNRGLDKREGLVTRAFSWSGRPDSNWRPSPWQGDALPLSHARNEGHYK